MHLWSYRLVQNWFYNVTCSREGLLGGSGAIVLSELVLASRASTVSAFLRLYPSVHQELQPSHVDSGFLHWRFLQLHPWDRIIVNQDTYLWNRESFEWWVTWLVLDSDGLGGDGTGFLMTRLVIIFLFLVKTRGAMLAGICLRLEADWNKSGWTVIITFFIVVIPCKKEYQGRLWESGMVPRYWSWVLDHLVVVNKVSKVSQVKQ